MIVKGGGNGDFEKPTTGMKNAVCCGVYDCGNQQQTNFETKLPEIKHLVIISFELAERMSTGKRFTLSKWFYLGNSPLHKKGNLRKMLDSWAGRQMSDEEADAGVDLDKLVGTPALLQCMKDQGSEYINVTSVLPAMDKTMMVENTEIPKFVLDKQAEAITPKPSPKKVDDDIPF